MPASHPARSIPEREQVTNLTVSVTDSNSVTAKRYVPKTASVTITVDSQVWSDHH